MSTPLVVPAESGKPLLKGLDNQVLYSRTNITSGTTLVSFFTFSVGGNVTEADTNIRVNGMLGDPNRFIIKGIAWGVDDGTALADFSALRNRGIAKVIFGNTPYWVIPLRIIPTYGSLFGFAATTATNTTIQGFGAGIPHFNNFYKLSLAYLSEKVEPGKPATISIAKTAIALSPSENFSVSLEFPGGVTLSGPVATSIYLQGVFFGAVR